MSSEIHLAFAHPSERAIATAEDTPLDRISLRDHIVEVEIGAFQAERGVTQEPPRSTNWLHMNFPLYSPTAPSAGRNPG